MCCPPNASEENDGNYEEPVEIVDREHRIVMYHGLSLPRAERDQHIRNRHGHFGTRHWWHGLDNFPTLNQYLSHQAMLGIYKYIVIMVNDRTLPSLVADLPDSQKLNFTLVGNFNRAYRAGQQAWQCLDDDHLSDLPDLVPSVSPLLPVELPDDLSDLPDLVP